MQFSLTKLFNAVKDYFYGFPERFEKAKKIFKEQEELRLIYRNRYTNMKSMNSFDVYLYNYVVLDDWTDEVDALLHFCVSEEKIAPDEVIDKLREYASKGVIDYSTENGKFRISTNQFKTFFSRFGRKLVGETQDIA